jgi:hypothetical protein
MKRRHADFECSELDKVGQKPSSFLIRLGRDCGDAALKHGMVLKIKRTEMCNCGNINIAFCSISLNTSGFQSVVSRALPSAKLSLFSYYKSGAARGGVVVKALRYKPAGRGFDSRRCHWNFSLT